MRVGFPPAWSTRTPGSARRGDADVRLVVLHHPWEWLAEWDRRRVRERVQQAAHFVLMGHQHVGEVQVSQGTGGDYVTIPAGASYDSSPLTSPGVSP